jgi:hypothetical protein
MITATLTLLVALPLAIFVDLTLDYLLRRISAGTLYLMWMNDR